MLLEFCVLFVFRFEILKDEPAVEFTNGILLVSLLASFGRFDRLVSFFVSSKRASNLLYLFYLALNNFSAEVRNRK